MPQSPPSGDSGGIDPVSAHLPSSGRYRGLLELPRVSAVTLCEELDELPIFCLGVDALPSWSGLIRGIEVSSDPPEGEHIGAEATGRILPVSSPL